jgi:hypothetical protein
MRKLLKLLETMALLRSSTTTRASVLISAFLQLVSRIAPLSCRHFSALRVLTLTSHARARMN